MRAFGRSVALGALSVLLLAAAPTAEAAVTVGSPLTAQVNSNIQQGCGTAACTVVNVAVPSGANVASPLTGVLVRWRMLGNASGAAFEIRVLRPVMGAGYTGVGTGAPEVPAGAGPTTFPTRLPIQAGDLIGLNTPGAGHNWLLGKAPEPGASYGQFDPALPDGATGSPPGFSSNVGLGFNGDVESDADQDDFGDETQDRCLGTAGAFSGCPKTFLLDDVSQKGRKPKVKVVATVPGAGTVEAGSPSDPALASASAKKSLKRATETLTSTTYQQAVLTLKLTKSAKRTLAEKGKLKTKVKVLYRPPGGPGFSQTRKVKLKA